MTDSVFTDEQIEAIASCGGLLPAKLLQLSGVGDGAALQRLGIASVAHLPAVGQHLQDHLKQYQQSVPHSLSISLYYPNPSAHLYFFLL